MSKKEPFNDAAQGHSEARQQQIKEWRKACDQALEQLREEQRRRHDQDMEKARQKILREHNRLDCRPAYTRRKAMTTKQLEERASQVVEAQNLRALNAVKNGYRARIEALENPERAGKAQLHEPNRSPSEIRTIFNASPKGRGERDSERER
ncbi:hypothetical protein NPS53_11770 [Pseudomonas putida]|uniref:hypothetical protein n=1 Tax=Pseudomonas putida TaxID=303 RepID=UPI002363C296|nr:hypothetical protein [Pseudomonas putida]MDD2140256.1 hypothetical protein [Pseudomonas putida]HDS1725602.1 hypothetical protein [Pseudomonas putida]